MTKTYALILFPLMLLAQQDPRHTIMMLQDRRDTGSADLVAFLASPEKTVREQALLAMANIQDTSYLPAVVPLLNDPEPSVRSMAAFAVGMIPKPSGTAALFRRLAVERERKCIAAVFNAIGMCGTAEDLKHLIRQTESYPEAWRPFVAQSLSRFAQRRLRDASASKYLMTLLDDPASVTPAAYALMRGADSALIRSNAKRLLPLMRSSSPSVRMWGATIAGMIGTDAAVQRLVTTAKNDKDWRVRVNAVRALRTVPAAAAVMTSLFGSPQEHVALTAVESYAVLTENVPSILDSAAVVKAIRSAAVLPSVKDQLRRLSAQRFGASAIPLIGSWREGGTASRAQRIRALGDTRSVSALPSVRAAMDQDVPSLVQCASIEAFQSIARSAPPDIQQEFLDRSAAMIGTRDAGISYTAAAALQDTAFTAAIRKQYLSRITNVYLGLRAPADLEPMVELLNLFGALRDTATLPAVRKGLSESERVIRTAAGSAFRSITGEDAVSDPMIHAAPAQWYRDSDLQLLERYSGAEVSTTQGSVTIMFAKNAAPLTVLNFILLSQKGYYDGLSFHRVVSNFVIQGGDPLGNGSGGPDYAIRTEVHPSAVYRQGAVGMASSGKDTEGSQWFITHCPTPHLDFRYTVFGYTRDAAAVDRIMIGDTILRVRLF